MKHSLQNEVKRLIVKRLSEEIKTCISENDAVSLHGLLSPFVASQKLFPYGVFSYMDSLKRVAEIDIPTSVFYNLLESSTNHIDKTANKGRKLERDIKGLLQKYENLLPYHLGTKHMFYSFLHFYFLHIDSKHSIEAHSLASRVMLYRKPIVVFLSALFYIDTLSSDTCLCDLIQRIDRPEFSIEVLKYAYSHPI